MSLQCPKSHQALWKERDKEENMRHLQKKKKKSLKKTTAEQPDAIARDAEFILIKPQARTERESLEGKRKLGQDSEDLKERVERTKLEEIRN